MSDDDTPTEPGLGRHEPKRRTVLKKLAAGGLAVGAVGTGFVGGAAATSDNAPQKEIVDLTGTTEYNPCLEEYVTYTSGSVVAQFQEFQINECRLHVNVSFTPVNLRAVGEESGAKYVGVGTSTYGYNVNLCEEGPYVHVEKTQLKLVSQGPGDDGTFTVMIRTVVNANGDTVVDVDSEPDCR